MNTVDIVVKDWFEWSYRAGGGGGAKGSGKMIMAKMRSCKILMRSCARRWKGMKGENGGTVKFTEAYRLQWYK